MHERKGWLWNGGIEESDRVSAPAFAIAMDTTHLQVSERLRRLAEMERGVLALFPNEQARARAEVGKVVVNASPRVF